jgi:hypothetical protein
METAPSLDSDRMVNHMVGTPTTSIVDAVTNTASENLKLGDIGEFMFTTTSTTTTTSVTKIARVTSQSTKYLD